MKNLAFWGSRNPWKSRIIIFILHILLAALAFCLTQLLQSVGIQKIGLSTPALLVFFCVIAIIYPFKGTIFHKTFYYRKAIDMLTITTTFLLFLSLFFNGFSELKHMHALGITPGSNQSIGVSNGFINDKKISILNNKKEITKKVKKGWRLFSKEKTPKPMSQGTKTLLIILTILGALGALYLVAILSCSLSCGGAEGLAIITLVAGIAVVFFLSVLVIRRISKAPLKTKEVKSPTIPENTKG